MTKKVTTREKAVEEFFKQIVNVMPPDWNCAELKYEGWTKRCPNLIKLLKEGYAE